MQRKVVFCDVIFLAHACHNCSCNIFDQLGTFQRIIQIFWIFWTFDVIICELTLCSFFSAAKTWKILSFVVALPGVGVCMLNTFLKEQSHSHEQPEFVPYSHLRIRSKVWPSSIQTDAVRNHVADWCVWISAAFSVGRRHQIPFP